MPKIKKGLKRWYVRLSLRSRTMLAMAMVCMVASLTVGICVYVVQNNVLEEKMNSQLEYSANQISLNIENLFGNINNNVTLLATDASVQQFLQEPDEVSGASAQMISDIYALLVYVNSMQSELAYSYITKEGSEQVIYLGPSRARANGLYDGLKELSEENRKVLIGPIHSPLVGSQEGKYIFCVMQTIYDIYELDKRLGALCLAVNEEKISQFLGGANGQELYVVDAAGTVISHKDSARIGQASDVFGNSGTEQPEKVTAQCAIAGTDWHVVGVMSLAANSSEQRSLFLWVLCMVLITLCLCMVVSTWFVHTFTKPFDVLIRHMERIAQGDWDRQLSLDKYGNEYSKISEGFNSMSGQIRILLEEAKETSVALKDSELSALKAQINPHFLYNSLDSIHWLASINDQKDISVLSLALAKFYRICLGNAKELIPLSEEISHVSNYLTIQSIRYGDSLRSEIHVSQDNVNLLVPSMTLQPLVENAIYHGIRGMEHPGTISILVYIKDDDLFIDVDDDGRGMTAEEMDKLNTALSQGRQKDQGHGVLNVHRRIILLFGERYGLTFFTNEKGGVTARIHMPARRG